MVAALSENPLPTVHVPTHENFVPYIARQLPLHGGAKRDKHRLKLQRIMSLGAGHISGQPVSRNEEFSNHCIMMPALHCRLNASGTRLVTHVDIFKGLCAAESQDECAAFSLMCHLQQHCRYIGVLLLILLAACSNKSECQRLTLPFHLS